MDQMELGNLNKNNNSQGDMLKFNLEMNLYLSQHESLFIPPVDVNFCKVKSSRNVYERSIELISNELKTKNIDKLKRKDVEKYKGEIQILFNSTLLSDYAIRLKDYVKEERFQHMATDIIVENVLMKAIMDDKVKKVYTKIKTQSKKKQLDIILGKPGSKGGLIHFDQPGVDDLLRMRYQDNPMQLIGKKIEPFGPYAWNYGIFKAINYLKDL